MQRAEAGGVLAGSLPPVRGRITTQAPLAQTTWFGVGGPAEVLFRPADVADLGQFLSRLDPAIPVTVIGVASNLLIRDGGVRGVVIRLGRGFAEITTHDARIACGSAALDVNVAAVAADYGIAGMEFLSGVPGTIGGAVRMNAGAYDGDIAQILRSVTVMDRRGQLHALTDVEFGYRHSNLPPDVIVISAALEGRRDDTARIRARIAEIKARREATQPIRTKTGGSTFKNPPGAKAWELIDRAGCRGLSRGGAQVSMLHCNFLVNTGGATAADLEDLGEEVRRRVQADSGVLLEWEIARVGERA
ncbi:MAG: UDP-N-acetylmuramate dehydrogenase [Alphaproteobacteria bacterium]|nr:UDP-N-acetylmuramate dehydrogenase [Alphaproteobacteria bacterium]